MVKHDCNQLRPDIPVIRIPWDDPATCVGCSVVGFMLVEEVRECPIRVDTPEEIERAAAEAGGGDDETK